MWGASKLAVRVATGYEAINNLALVKKTTYSPGDLQKKRMERDHERLVQEFDGRPKPSF